MSNQLIHCSVCGAVIARRAKRCPACGAKSKRPFYTKWWFWAILILLVIIVTSGGSEEKPYVEPSVQTSGIDSSQTVSTTAATAQAATASATTTATEAATTAAPVKTAYQVGDVLQDGDMKIVYMSSGDYIEENEFSQPEDGQKYIYLQFAFENTSTQHDASISFYSFTCYADGYAAEMYYGGNEDLSATLSAGRATTGYIYFTVPEDAEEIEVEYETNVFTEEKINFVFEGDQDAGYALDLDLTPTEGAYAVGEVAESSKLKITYVACEKYVSDTIFYEPRDGYEYISCIFEFENIGSDDENVSIWDFDCYADGVYCEDVYLREDALSATLSAGRKTKGSVTFEVPLDATVVEVEFLSNYWTSNRVVFTAK